MRRLDYKLIEGLVPAGATVLDLGCGDGELLAELIAEKHVRGSGVEISPEAVEACVAKGLSVFQGDLDEGLADYADGSFDVVREMVRVGKLAIVSFPNFAHWAVRGALVAHGRMPVSRELPYQWYDTPNIHLCTVKDFRDLCHRERLCIESELYLRSFERPSPRLRRPNVTARIALFAVTDCP
jgi:methionine biosynthesis protein MetW